MLYVYRISSIKAPTPIRAWVVMDNDTIRLCDCAATCLWNQFKSFIVVICAGSKSFVAKQWSHYKGLERSYENSLWRPRSDAIFGGFWYFLVFFWCFLVCVCACACACACVCVCVCVFILYMCMFCVSIVVGCSTQSMCTRTCTPCTHLRTCMYVGVHSCVTMCVCVCTCVWCTRVCIP